MVTKSNKMRNFFERGPLTHGTVMGGPPSARNSVQMQQYGTNLANKLGLNFNYDALQMPNMFSPQADGQLPGVRGQSVGRQGMTAKSFGPGARPRRVIHQLDTSMATKKRSQSTLKKTVESSVEQGNDLLKLLVGHTISRSKDNSAEDGMSTQKLQERI